MIYKLYYKDVCIGTVKESGQDFPSFFGTIEYSSGRLPSEIQQFIDYSIESDNLFERDEKEYDKFEEKNEQKFSSFIDSQEWYLLTEKNERINILVPILHNDYTVTWRLNPKR